MKVIFVFDDQSIIVSPIEDIQLRQLNDKTTGLVIPAGKNEQGEELIRPLITFPVTISPILEDKINSSQSPSPARKKKKKPSTSSTKILPIKKKRG